MLTVAAIIVLLIVCIVVIGKEEIKEKATAKENVGMVHKKRGTGMNIYSPDVGLNE